MPHPLQMLLWNHSQFGKGHVCYQCHKTGVKSDRLGIHCNWSSFRMWFNIHERENFILFDKIPVSIIKLSVYVYKLAFFFWLSPRTYHFLFEKRLIIDWRYFWRNIALSLILWVSPDYPLNIMFNCIFIPLWNFYTMWTSRKKYSKMCLSENKDVYMNIHCSCLFKFDNNGGFNFII